MSIPHMLRSTTLFQQVLISGAVQDSLTNSTPAGALEVRLIDRDNGDAYPLQGRVTPDGRFAFFGNPATAFPEFATREYHLRVEAGTPFHQTHGHDFDLAQASPGPAQPARVAYPEPLPGLGQMHVLEYNGSGLPVTGITIELERLPVRLSGRVVSSHEPLVGLDGVSIQLDPDSAGPTVNSAADGSFAFPNPLPLVLTIDLVATRAEYEEFTQTLDLDYTQPIQKILIVMKKN